MTIAIEVVVGILLALFLCVGFIAGAVWATLGLDDENDEVDD